MYHQAITPDSVPDLLLHEAGMPPTHTPAAALKQLPDSLKRNLKLIHVGNRSFKANFESEGFERVKVGFEHTLVVPVEPSPHARTAATLQILVNVDLFHGALDLSAAVELLQASRDRAYAPGETICSAGAPLEGLQVLRCLPPPPSEGTPPLLPPPSPMG